MLNSVIQAKSNEILSKAVAEEMENRESRDNTAQLESVGLVTDMLEKQVS